MLIGKRHASFLLHPVIQPFFRIVRGQCGLDALPDAPRPEVPMEVGDPLPPLELIDAYNFVRHRWVDLAGITNSKPTANLNPPGEFIGMPDRVVRVRIQCDQGKCLVSRVAASVTGTPSP